MYGVPCTYVHIWISQYTHVYIRHCTVQCTVYTVHMYTYGPASTLVFTAITALYSVRCIPYTCTPMGPPLHYVHSRHCLVQCTVYKVHMYTYKPASTLMFTAGTVLYSVRCTPYTCTHVNHLVHSCLQQALYCTVYGVPPTHVHIWSNQYTHVYSRHCTVTMYCVHCTQV